MSRSFLRSADLSRDDILNLCDKARNYRDQTLKILSHKIVGLLFFENSSRTRSSFEMAAYRLGAQCVYIGAEGSSIAKGETELDTARILDCNGVDALVVRTGTNGMPAAIAELCRAPVLNAGEGTLDHPSQGLLDALTLLDHFDGSLEGKTIAIVGDIAHSRVARSNMHILPTLGARVKLVGPQSLLPSDPGDACALHNDLREGLSGADAVMTLRIQKERFEGDAIPDEAAYHAQYGINHTTLDWANHGAPVLHPMPVNRGVELSGDLADDAARSLLWQQMQNGLIMRMAMLEEAVHG